MVVICNLKMLIYNWANQLTGNRCDRYNFFV